MKTFITGKHSIESAIKNPLRKNLVFYGSKQSAYQYGFKGPFVESEEEKLQVDEYVIYSQYEDLPNRCILLDSIMDPRNCGSIIRSAAILDYGVLVRDRGSPINETVVRCAAGGIDCTPVVKVKNIDDMFKKMRKMDYWFTGLSSEGDHFIHDVKFNKIVLVIGSEGKGISRLVEENCDLLAKLQTSSRMKIYNASVAAALAMYQLIPIKN
jgi:23S rRNA (guanosine2251-2'-O)-methyltransferase